MGTKTVDEAAEAPTDEQPVDITKTDKADEADEAKESAEVTENETEATAETDEADEADEDVTDEEVAPAAGATGVGQGAGAVVAAVLGFLSLSGSWIGTIAGARQTLVGQLGTSSSASVAKQIQAVYGDAWQATALWAGIFALAALVVGVVVLARPAFGNPATPQAAWIKSVSWAGVVLGVVGLLLAVLKYTDALLGLPSAS